MRFLASYLLIFSPSCLLLSELEQDMVHYSWQNIITIHWDDQKQCFVRADSVTSDSRAVVYTTMPACPTSRLAPAGCASLHLHRSMVWMRHESVVWCHVTPDRSPVCRYASWWRMMCSGSIQPAHSLHPAWGHPNVKHSSLHPRTAFH